MAKQKDDGITWCDYTLNPWVGCRKVSPGCKNCYAERHVNRFGKFSSRTLTGEGTWGNPLRWNKKASVEGKRPRVFCASLADVFELHEGPIINRAGERMFWPHNSIDSPLWIPASHAAGDELPVTMGDVRQRLFKLIDQTIHLDYLLLTKRIENVGVMWPIHPSGRHQEGMSFKDAYRRDNVWIGTSIENQDVLEKRLEALFRLRDLVPVLWLSIEPMLGPIDFRKLPPFWCRACKRFESKAVMDPNLPCFRWQADTMTMIDWVVAGGESGPDARPSNPAWFRSLRNQCESWLIPFHFKQYGEYVGEMDLTDAMLGKRRKEQIEDDCFVRIQKGPDGRPVDYTGDYIYRVGKKKSGRLLDGTLHDAFPRVEATRA